MIDVHTIRLALLATLACTPTSLFGGGMPGEFWLGAGAQCHFQTLQVAVGAVPNGSIIRIASNQEYADTNVVISNRSMTLLGGYADCTGTPGPDPVFTGAPGANAAVIRFQTQVNPHELTLRRLRIEGGTNSGLSLAGRVDVELDRVSIDRSTADSGGGIVIFGVAPAITRLRLTSTIIGNFDAEPYSGNHAQVRGGGIACQFATITLNGAVIRNNTSDSMGGGLYTETCRVDTYVQEFFHAEEGGIGALIANNRAEAGGGIHASYTSILELGPVTGLNAIRDNEADTGGGVYLSGSGTRLEGAGLFIDGNLAHQFGGAGRLLDAAALVLRRLPLLAQAGEAPHAADPRGVAQLAYRCYFAVECNGVRFNRAQAQTGGAFHTTSALLALGNTAITDNYSAQGSALQLIATSSRIENSLLARNDNGTGELVRLAAASNLVVNSSTITGNTIGDSVFRTIPAEGANNLVLLNSIIWQPGTVVLDDTPIDTNQSTCVNAHEAESVAAVSHDPGFVDATSGNYRLHSTSNNIDACDDPFFGASAADILGQSRPADLGNAYANGIHDRGAFELSDRIFASHMGEPPPF